MGLKFVFFLSASSFLFSVALLRALLFCLAGWLALTLVTTQVLGWIRGGSIVPTWIRSDEHGSKRSVAF